MTRVITIVVNDAGFHVHEGEAFAHHLCWDEMLGQIAALTIPFRDRPHLFRMQTPDEMLAQRERSRERAAEYRAEREKEGP